ncbi:hypothetical protein EDB92DRAFT_163230 [Lactarius akahatsu]|uniref:Uncharacterized protein n=1 Tax=Lactarius akahatsu TaxID=416441 RepID=A0AAD4LJW6_9AGAM|nr:hypothetical protein EDB92DRAFT_163230 [Lactarius akahatsu]
MQVPSCTNVRIRSTADVHKIFYAVYLGLLPMITRRLDAKSARPCPPAIVTLGKTEALMLSLASASNASPRVATGPLLVYEMNFYSITRNGNLRRVRTVRELGRLLVLVPRSQSRFNLLRSDSQPARDWDPFVKQTYSVYLSENEGSKRKWHLTAYFTQATVDSLGTVDDIPVLKDLVVPDGLFKSSRRTKTRSSRANTTTHAPEGTPDLSAQLSSSGKTGGQIAPVADPSSTQNRPTLQVAAQQSTSQQNQGLPPPSPYPQDLFNAQSPDYPGLPCKPGSACATRCIRTHLWGFIHTFSTSS